MVLPDPLFERQEGPEQQPDQPSQLNQPDQLEDQSEQLPLLDQPEEQEHLKESEQPEQLDQLLDQSGQQLDQSDQQPGPSGISSHLLESVLQEENENETDTEEDQLPIIDKEIAHLTPAEIVQKFGGKAVYRLIFRHKHPKGILRGSGINALLQLNETAPLKHGSLALELGFTQGLLLNPSPGEGSTTYDVQTSATKTDAKSSKDGASSLTIEEYLQICKNHLSFTEAELEFASQLYTIVDGSGQTGVSVVSLEHHSALTVCPHSLGMEDHLQQLANFQMVRSHSYSHMYYSCGQVGSTELITAT